MEYILCHNNAQWTKLPKNQYISFVLYSKYFVFLQNNQENQLSNWVHSEKVLNEKNVSQLDELPANNLKILKKGPFSFLLSWQHCVTWYSSWQRSNKDEDSGLHTATKWPFWLYLIFLKIQSFLIRQKIREICNVEKKILEPKS